MLSMCAMRSSLAAEASRSGFASPEVGVLYQCSIAFVNAGKKDEQDADPKKASKKGAKAKNMPQPPQDAPEPDEKDLPF